MKIISVKGTQDLLSKSYQIFKHIVNVAAQVAQNYGYNEISLPILEHTELFQRSLGDVSDIVKKEMYTFLDKKERSLTLRPEFTVSVARAVLSNELHQNLPLRLFLSGPLFRYERPQKGRYRQFHQINFEYIGARSAAIDAETISLAWDILMKLNLESTTLELNTLGDAESRSLYKDQLVQYYTKYKNDLSEDSKIRFDKNPLRILDSKDEGDKKINEGAPRVLDFLSSESQKFFEDLCMHLNDMNIKYKINSKLVRGLDYYTDTVFEFVTDKLGAQSAVIAGGRYDNLIKQLGGPSIPAVGFGVGIERLMELFKGEMDTKRIVSIIVLDKKFASSALKIAHHIRANNVTTTIEQTSNLSKAMKNSLSNNAKFIIFIGEAEDAQNKFKLKDLDTREEKLVTQDQLIKIIGNYEF